MRETPKNPSVHKACPICVQALEKVQQVYALGGNSLIRLDNKHINDIAWEMYLKTK
jgi:hypothetical protein